MMALLDSGRKAPKSGTVKTLVVFVHGYGADGNDLLSLGDPLAEHMPDTVFYAPNAPNKCQMNPMGYEWFPIPWIDGSTEEAANAGMDESAQLFDDWLTEIMATEGVSAAQTMLVGFSQGTMMSLHVGPRRAEQLAGIVGFSGRLLRPEALGDVQSKPPILLIHGDADDVVPPVSMPEAAEALTGAGFEVFTHVSKGTGHGIAPDGLGLSLQFMIEKFGKAAK
ncbi:dienelactone hydrolase family protein [Amylibacter sp. IMCC11727]|uniref:alpha/beta hydrolase n=1 Tax=Amylibacter sp. IMCC11727 TaxID=3039851 RepID=UPI00244DBF26|nr:dienelactone hydrolase family protein [Amylibacter sp. IMCC11727]WGI20876.1 dienelactone hydrolase family protein [Amylibacter sp. IMCC11727]